MMTVSHDWSLHLIRKAGGSPEQQIAASLVITAREGCAAGNAEDCQWLEVCGVAYLSLICPAEVDEWAVLERLLADVPERKPTKGWRQNAERFVQMVLIGLEAQHADDAGLPEMRARTTPQPRGDPFRHLEEAAVPSV